LSKNGWNVVEKREASFGMKERLDKLLTAGGFVASRERAQALILAGRVLVDEQKVEKPGTQVDASAQLRILGDQQRYVSRGGLKLEHALSHWNIELQGSSCLDIGTSTGGFTDCMLQHGASHVLAVDTGYGQIAHSLRTDPRVSLMERTNARNLKIDALPPGIVFLAMDVSFISATLVLPAVIAAGFYHHPRTITAEAVILVKPQFEAGREWIGKGGIVRDPEAHQIAIERVKASVMSLGAENLDVIPSPILGAEGNREFLLHATFPARR
jgi:23S rRNA (cytidine1920-2'-O)/16S rRNA (cytidine1409-2'-O)-methyltransferase